MAEPQRGRAFFAGQRTAPGLDVEASIDRGIAAGTPSRRSSAASGGALGGLAGVGMGAVFGGPVGAAIGGLVGVLGYMDQQRQAKQVAAWEGSLADKSEKAKHALAGVVNDEEATPGDKAQATERFRLESEFLENIRGLGPQEGQRMLAEVSQKDRENQQTIDREAMTRQRDHVLQSREKLAADGRALFARQVTLEREMGEAAALLSDESLDLSKPQVQAQLGKLLQQTQRNMLANAEDMTDALRGAGGLSFLGTIAQIAAGALKAEDMEFSREEWRTLLAANEQATQRAHIRERQALGEAANVHAQVSDRVGLPADEFISLLSRFQDAESVDDVPQIAPRGGYRPGVEATKRPTNGLIDQGADAARGYLDQVAPSLGLPQSVKDWWQGVKTRQQEFQAPYIQEREAREREEAARRGEFRGGQVERDR